MPASSEREISLSYQRAATLREVWLEVSTRATGRKGIRRNQNGNGSGRAKEKNAPQKVIPEPRRNGS